MTAERAAAALDAAGIDYETTRHGPAGSLAEAAALRGVEPGDLIKTLVLRRAADDYVLVLVPGDRVISWPRLREFLGVSRMSMPDAEVARDVTGYERGTITPFGTLTRLPVVADVRVAEPRRRVSIGGGDHGVGATLDAQDLIRAVDARVADVTDPP
ncbi:aminoacyl-tRNA deacylase [Paraoerskovia marina]|uniref:aminoacyl-tRNA deacylase n=1 Tax=Paraoerskovia marina TaxID=545619 RepID=UPI0004923EDB|nr:YbaK/EbsC family protein [Paraoerskovia marina]